MRYTPVRDVMYSVLPSSPQLQFAGVSGGLMVPRCLPPGANTHTPLVTCSEIYR